MSLCITPNYTNLRIFGCLCYPWLKPYTSHKLDQKSCPCVFLGFSLQHHASKCLDISNNKIYLSRHVTYHETIFPFQTDPSTSPSNLGSLHSFNWFPCSNLSTYPWVSHLMPISSSDLNSLSLSSFLPLHTTILFHYHPNKSPIPTLTPHSLPHLLPHTPHPNPLLSLYPLQSRL